MHRTATLAFALLPIAATAVQADVRLPAILGSNMVLQAETDAPFWGWAEPGEEVTVTPSWPGADPVTVTAGDQGEWRCELATPGAGGDHSITVTGSNTIELTNVLVGEVWLASGQSNMEWPLRITDNAEQAIAAADHPHIRLFLVQNAISPTPLDDCNGEWVECSPETVTNFSAVAYYFGRRLQDELDVPVGLIAADWGGTPAEAWTSAESLGEFPRHAPGLALMRMLREDPAALDREYENALAAWKSKYETAEQLIWATDALEDDSWPTIEEPGGWNRTMPDRDGTVWYRKTVEIPAAWAGKELQLELGPIDDEDVTYFRGTEIGSMRGGGKWQTPRKYTVPGKLVEAGSAVVAVAAIDTGGGAGFTGGPTQMFLAPIGGSESERISLAGEWRHKPADERGGIPPQPTKRAMNAHTPTSLFNGMIAPVHPFAIRGAIWYQGESNRGAAHEYRSLFPAMITDWRTHWGYDFPFYFVQIAPYTYGGDSGQTAELREAQLMTLDRVGNTGMVVTMDIGNPRDIHPRNKLDVGERLALWPLANVYGKTDLEFSGPLFESVEFHGRQARVHLSHAGGLHSRGGVPKGFEVAGDDGVWRAAGALIDGETILVSAYGVPKPVAVRYGWDDDGEPNLFNGDGLPASPFRSDDWKRVTQPGD